MLTFIVSVLRCLFAGGWFPSQRVVLQTNGLVFPLFGDQLFDSIGVNWGVGLLALLSLGLGLPFLPLVRNYPRSGALLTASRYMCMVPGYEMSVKETGDAYLTQICPSCDGCV
jgi:hypothetical protein